MPRNCRIPHPGHFPERFDLTRALALLQERKAALEADPEGAARAAEEEEAAGEKSSKS